MIALAPAKINIGLYVVEKRKDGYHNIVTCMVPIKWFDAVEVVKTKDQNSKLCIYGDFKQDVPQGDNTILKTLNLIKDKHSIPGVEVHLLKQIPAGTGLGGASSDAATTINLLDKLFELNLSLKEKHLIADQIGSDVPFFIKSRPAIASGKGEKLEYVDLPWLADYFIVIVVPKEKLSTAEMYSRIKGYMKPPKNFKQLLIKGPRYWKNKIINQFEHIAESIYPHLADIKKTLYEAGSEYASLSGSGSAYFGLFNKRQIQQLSDILNMIKIIDNLRIVRYVSIL